MTTVIKHACEIRSPIFLLLFFFFISFLMVCYAKGEHIQAQSFPILKDPALKVENLTTIHHPTSIAILDNDDILVLKKHDGKVMRIINGNILPEPLLDVNVADKTERGMLGIVVKKQPKSITQVFLYYTESKIDNSDRCPEITYCEAGSDPLGNRLYRYDLVGGKLVNPKLLLDLPAVPGSDHLGGALTMGPDEDIYVIVGDGDSCYHNQCNRSDSVLWSKTSNVENGLDPEGRGGILRVTSQGKAVGDGILGEKFPLNMYYAYGIRNGFGLDFDPVAGRLWDTENGQTFGDEVNLVDVGFNSGWNKVQGIWNIINYSSSASKHGGVFNLTNNLVDFNGKGKYRSPELVWNTTVAPTAIKFLPTSKLGKQYENQLFIGDFKNGNIYHFELNQDRTGLELSGPLKDKIVNAADESSQAIFGQGFGSISDIEIGPDGSMYVVSILTDTIFKISPKNY